MTILSQRRSKLAFETNSLIWERGRSREVVIECAPTHAIVRLKGTRHRMTLSWESVYRLAAAAAAAHDRAEKRAARKAGAR